MDNDHKLAETQEATKEQFLRIYELHGDAIFRFCVLKVSTREVAQDLTQEVFMRFWQGLREGAEIRNERAFLYTVARNLVIDWYRKKKETSLDVLTEEGKEFASTEHFSIPDQAEARRIMKVIEMLDDDSREVLLLRFVEGLSPREIAVICDESANTVSVRIHRALKKVQEHIHAYE